MRRGDKAGGSSRRGPDLDTGEQFRVELWDVAEVRVIRGRRALHAIVHCWRPHKKLASVDGSANLEIADNRNFSGSTPLYEMAYSQYKLAGGQY